MRVGLFGPADSNLRMLREVCGVHIAAREGRVRLNGKREAVAKAANLLEMMQDRLSHQDHLGRSDMLDLIQSAACELSQEKNDPAGAISVLADGRSISPRSDGQREYLKAMRKNDLVFCTGPAGTGKTYLAVAIAVSMLKDKNIRRIVLARPAVEAGEKLGFLPGDLQAKVNPYLRPLFDALGDMMDYSQVKRFLYNDVIEVIPLAFMRGRTFNEALVILDEAQNTTPLQMLMFLTRLGRDSKMIVTGDDSQIDLPSGQGSGLLDAKRRLRGIKGIVMVRLTEVDIVRHRLVQNVVKAYDSDGRVSHGAAVGRSSLKEASGGGL